MLINQYYKNNYHEKKSFVDTLGLSFTDNETIAFVGGGGKSSIIKELSNELKTLKKRTIITTTTHIFAPDQDVVLIEDFDKIKHELDKNYAVTVGIPCDNKKLKSVSDAFLERLANICDVLLIEADGSKHMPIKAPAIHEPVIPPFTTLVVGVAGLDCLNKPLNQTSHRPEILANILNKRQDSILEPKDIAKILESEQGQKKNVTCRYEIILNKADNLSLFEQALETASYLISEKCVISSLEFNNKKITKLI